MEREGLLPIYIYADDAIRNASDLEWNYITAGAWVSGHTELMTMSDLFSGDFHSLVLLRFMD